MLRFVLALLVLLLPAVALAQNQPPVADAGEDQTVFLGEVAQLDGTSSYDPDGDPIVVWMWEFESAPAASAATLNNRFGSTPSFQPDFVGEYVVSLTVNDGLAWSPQDAVVVGVVENQPPVAQATGSPTRGKVPLVVEFDGSASFDPEGGILEYTWTFGDGSLPMLGAVVSKTYTSAGVYDATLGVVDDFGLVDSESLLITVTVPPQLIDLGDRTRDEATGLDWLDVTETQGLSYDAIIAGAGGWVAAGWRHARLQEVCDFFTTHAVAPADPCGSGSEFYASDASVVPVQALLGITRALPTADDTFGFVDNGTVGPDVGIAELRFSGGSVSIAGVDSASSIYDRTSTSPNVGHFLVRPYASAVPSLHPLALYTLVPGLLVGVGLVAMRRRHRSLLKSPLCRRR